MIRPARSFLVASPSPSIEDFVADDPFPKVDVTDDRARADDLIDGVRVTALVSHFDSRGSLCELLTTRDGPIEPIVHVYHVTAQANSRRAWVYHRLQYDRLAYVNGQFRIVLYDPRPRSPTFGMFNVFILGQDQPGLVCIPPFVIHGVHNIGDETAAFINMPTKAWDPRAPDK